ncbi:MAG TPA: DUF692 domain-containing protein [Myxococcaceae bacterium]|nr:DUF692 domain-containing protein [Myxococcaceae bacterium]
MSFSRKSLGHGVGLRTKHFGDYLAAPPPVDWLEAISENFMAPGGRPIAVLETVRRDVPVVLHGVSLSIGSVDPLSERYLDDLTALVRRIEPPWISDHLCWGTHGGRYVHDLWPLPYTEEALAHVVARVERVQERLRRQILLENVSSYVGFKDSTMTEWHFLAEVARRADCGILLDINNVYVSARNHGFDAFEYLAGIPPDRVGQFHLAGHSNKGRYLLDAHDHPVPDPVWQLYRAAVHRFGPVSTLIEWDDAIPSLERLVDESRRAATIEAETLQGDLKKAVP